MKVDVLIVGAGPTGLMLANQLGRRGIRTMIIDRHDGPARQTRAMGVQARTLEIYAKLGIAQTAIERGAVTAGVNLWANARHKARVPVREAGQGLSAFPFMLMLGQDENEAILGGQLAQWGIDVRWNTELLALEQHAGHVTVTLKQPEGSVGQVTAAWVAGCDGARSAVRERCGIGFPGAAYEHVFFVADTEATGDMVPDELNAYLWRKGFHLFFPIRGRNRWRVIGILPTELRDRSGLSFDDVIPHVRQEAGSRLAFQRCHWFSTYRIQHRHAERFRDRRCFLLGDAAHIHSPMGAQGMNTGLQDAYNLAWKLALVVQGQADEALLDTYEAERLPVAQALLRGTDRAFGLVVSDTPLAAFFRTRVMGNVASVAMRFRTVQRRAYRLISQIGIRYRRSPLSLTLDGLSDAGPRAGDRFPWPQLRVTNDDQGEQRVEQLDDRKFHVIVHGQPAPAMPLGGMVNTWIVAQDADNARELARANVAGACFFLIRPDGHIAVAGTHLDPEQLIGHLSERHIHLGESRTAHLASNPVETLAWMRVIPDRSMQR